MDWTPVQPFDAFVLEEPMFEEKSLDPQMVLHWRSVLDRLAEGNEADWDFFLHQFEGPLSSHPATCLTTTQDGQSLLHLAIIANQYRAALALAQSPYLKLKKNDFGFSSIDLAQYLGRVAIEELLAPVEQRSFLEQPQVEFSEPERLPVATLEYLSHPVFESYGVLKEVLTRTKKAKEEDEIPTEKIWMGIYFDNEIRKQLNPAVNVRYIDDAVGWGVFAAQKIPVCSFVGEYTGYVEVRKPRHLKDKYYCIRYPSWQMWKKRFVIDGERKGNFTRFINHSDKPNLSLQSVFYKGLSRMIFVSTEEIFEGTQLTFDYGDIFWKECKQTPIEF